nr:MAG TPA: hypothetical protein [Caudoviricetes sp.]
MTRARSRCRLNLSPLNKIPNKTKAVGATNSCGFLVLQPEVEVV